MEGRNQQNFFVAFAALAGLAVFGLGSCREREGEGADSAERTQASVVQRDWPLFRGDPEMQGVAGEILPAGLDLAWTYEVGGDGAGAPLEASPVIAGGVVYLGTQGGDFLAIDLEKGTETWKFSADGPVKAPAAVLVGENGSTVYFGDDYGFVYALDAATGEERWRFETEGKIEGGVNLWTPTEGSSRVLIGSHDYFLYCLDSESGELIWKHETGNYIVATPTLIALAGQEAVCFGGCDGLLHILPVAGDGSSEGKREVEIGSYIANTTAVRDGIAYVAHNGGEVLAIDLSSGEEAWRIATGVEYTASPAVDAEKLYVAGPDKRLVAIDRVTGEEIWAFLATRSLDSSPVVAGDLVWQASTDGRLYAVAAADGSEQWQFDLGTRLKASPAVSRGTLVVCGGDGKVYAFR